MSRRHWCALLGLPLVAALAAAALAGDAGAPAVTELPAPQWVAGADVRGKAQLSWIRNPAFAKVRVYRRDEGPRTAFRPLADSAEGSWLDESVAPGRTYRYRLVGIGADGREGRPSAELAVRIRAVQLRQPEPPQLEGYLVVGDGVNLRWTEREGEDVIAWNVYRKSAPETEFRLVGSTRSANFHDSGLEPERSYVYAVTALDSSFQETAFSKELPVRLPRPRTITEAPRPAVTWRVRRTRLVGVVVGGGDLTLERPADVAVGPLSGSVYVADSGHNLVFVFSAAGVFERIIGANAAGDSAFRNMLGVAVDAEENLYVVDAGAAAVQAYTRLGRAGRRFELRAEPGQPTGLIDAAVGADGRIWIVDNYNNRVTVLLSDGASSTFGTPGARGGEFSAPTFCAFDGSGQLYVSDCLNARVQVFSGAGEFVRAFGRPERGPGGFGRPKGVAVSAGGETYVADSWLNTVQVFDPQGRFVAVLADENGQPLDLGSPNGVALGAGNRVYIAERLAARLQIRELIDVP